MWYHYISKGSTAITKQGMEYPDSLLGAKGALESHVAGETEGSICWELQGKFLLSLMKRTGKRGSLLFTPSHLLILYLMRMLWMTKSLKK